MPSPGDGWMPSTLLMLMTEPPPRCFITGCTSLPSSNGAFTFTPMILSNAAVAQSCTGPNTGLAAALFTTMSTPP